ncbi:MAG TPA: hypothetical protein VME18_03080 [Acidobacteriaceae bacterium]|nr:hypothetical protein [Acidobacteriaceae bacterium]
MSKPAPPMHIRLTEDVGLLPAGFVVLVPREEAVRLIARRKATAVDAYRQQSADLVLSQSEYEKATAYYSERVSLIS